MCIGSANCNIQHNVSQDAEVQYEEGYKQLIRVRDLVIRSRVSRLQIAYTLCTTDNISTPFSLTTQIISYNLNYDYFANHRSSILFVKRRYNRIYMIIFVFRKLSYFKWYQWAYIVKLYILFLIECRRFQNVLKLAVLDTNVVICKKNRTNKCASKYYCHSFRSPSSKLKFKINDFVQQHVE